MDEVYCKMYGPWKCIEQKRGIVRRVASYTIDKLYEYTDRWKEGDIGYARTEYRATARYVNIQLLW